MDDFGLLVGRYLSSLPSMTDQELRELLLDSAGRLVISGRYLEDDAHNSGDAGIQILAVRKDTEGSVAGSDGDYTPLQVTADGRLRVDAKLEANFDYVYDEDSAHTNEDSGAFVLAVRQDTLASSTTTDGDYAAFKVNAKGELYVKDTDVLTKLGDIDTSLNNIETDVSNLTHVEDTAHNTGDTGLMPLAVRHDANTSLVDTDGDYAPLQVDSLGRLKIVASITSCSVGSEAYSVTDDFVADADGLETITASGTPWITVASLALSSGTAYIYGWQWACDQNAQARLITDDTADIIVYKNSLNSSAMPSISEHFSECGRIEIAGATDLVIKLQIKKRSQAQGDALGTGSMHIRVV